MVHRLHDDAGRAFVGQTGGEQRQDFALLVGIDKGPLSPAERLRGPVVERDRLCEDGFLAHQVVLDAILGVVLGARLGDASGLALPVVQQDIVLIVRPPDRRVFELAPLGSRLSPLRSTV